MIRRTSLSVAFMVGLMVAACLATVGAADKKKAAPAAAPVWPLPPDLPRIRYVTAYHGLTDFKKPGGGWKSLLIGPDIDRPATQLMKLRQEHEAKIEALLTEAQRKRWQQLLGEPFELRD